MTHRTNTLKFIIESNAIEGIYKAPTHDEIVASKDFLALDNILVADLELLVSVYQPGAVLRRVVGINVRVGNHSAPPGGLRIEADLIDLLTTLSARDPYGTHQLYETLHPFTDGNGRSGRMIWLWQMVRQGAVNLSFLHHWYYQSLEANR